MQKLIKHSFIIDNIRSITHSKIDYVLSYPDETHDFWECIYVLNGIIGIAENNNIYKLSKGQIIFHRPMEFHRAWSEDDKGYEILLISFHTNTNFLNPLGDGVMELNLEMQNELLEAFNSVRNHIFRANNYSILSEGDELNAEIAIRHFELFLLKLMASSKKFIRLHETHNPTADNYKTIMNVLHENICNDLSVKDIATLSNLSVSNLNKIFKKYTGTGVMYHFNRMKIIRAMKMLQKDMTIAEISDALSFSSQSYFLTVFKRYTGTVPSEYRKNKVNKIK